MLNCNTDSAKKKGAKNGNGTLLQLIPFIWAFLKEFYSNF